MAGLVNPALKSTQRCTISSRLARNAQDGVAGPCDGSQFAEVPFFTSTAGAEVMPRNKSTPKRLDISGGELELPNDI